MSSEDHEQSPLLEDDSDTEEVILYEEIQPPETEDAPPAYSEAMWGKSRLIGDEEDSADEATEQPVGPRRVVVPKDNNTFGFTIGSQSPVHVVSIDANGPASRQGIQPYDQILEINGVDVMRMDLQAVAAIIENATTSLTLVVMKPPSIPETPTTFHATNSDPEDPVLWREALGEMANSFRGNRGGNPANVIDDSGAPPTHLGYAFCSFLFCPCVGGMAIYHAFKSRQSWRRGDHMRSEAHSVTAKKMASMAVFYGFMLILLYIFTADSQL